MHVMKSCCHMKGFLSFLALSLIGKNPMSGEDIRNELKERKGTKPSPGTIYPVLKALSQAGLIEEIGAGKKEKKYKITSKGKKELKDATTRFCAMFFDLREDMDSYCRCR